MKKVLVLSTLLAAGLALFASGILNAGPTLNTKRPRVVQPKPSPRMAKKLAVKRPLANEFYSIRLADRGGLPLVCYFNRPCKVTGILGTGGGMFFKLTSETGATHSGVRMSWSKNEATFKITRRVPVGYYDLQITNARGIAVSNSIRVVANHHGADMPQTEACKRNADADRDGHVALSCGGDDCDDRDPERYPGNVEVCDALNRDEDCDASTFGFRDADGDGYGDLRCCNGSNCGNDCDDRRPAVHPGSCEPANQIDDDCDGAVDER